MRENSSWGVRRSVGDATLLASLRVGNGSGPARDGGDASGDPSAGAAAAGSE